MSSPEADVIWVLLPGDVEGDAGGSAGLSQTLQTQVGAEAGCSSLGTTTGTPALSHLPRPLSSSRAVIMCFSNRNLPAWRGNDFLTSHGAVIASACQSSTFQSHTSRPKHGSAMVGE